MNEKITRQIEEMKKQTLGVEVEMNNISRDRAAKIAPPCSEQADFRIRQAGTDTAHGQLGTGREENGNSKRMSAFRDQTVRNANW